MLKLASYNLKPDTKPMATYISSSDKKHWTILSPKRDARPTSDAPTPQRCPFCEGNEADTPPEVDRFPTGPANTPGWLVRVVPNKYKITDTHEVIIHSPDHNKDIRELSTEQVENIFKMYKKRALEQQKNGQVIIFCNHGKDAGASLRHPHSQLCLVPNSTPISTPPLEPIENIITEEFGLTSYCPAFSEWPYEVWITKKTDKQESFFSASQQDVTYLALTTQKLLNSLTKILSVSATPMSYNYYISLTSPWYLRIIPKTITRAGFELGTGISVNTVNPKEVADNLRHSSAGLNANSER